MAVAAADKRLVRERSDERCEYCQARSAWEPFHVYHVEHIIARQHGGGDETENLALSCHHCNLRKGPNLTSLDPDSGRTTELFHPRLHVWAEHFRLSGARIAGLTAAGRTTVFLLDMNAPHRIELRQINLARF